MSWTGHADVLSTLRAGRNVVVVLPVQRLCETTVRTAAAYAQDRGGSLAFALIMPWPPALSSGAVSLPYGQLWFDYEMQTDVDLSAFLYDADVSWSLVPVFHAPRDIPCLVRSADAGIVLIPDSGRPGRFSTARRRTRRLAAVVTLDTGVPVHSVRTPWQEPVLPQDSPV